MNKAIKISGLISTVLLMCGFVFKSNHYPGANAILMAGSGVGVLLFIFLMANVSGKNATGIEKLSLIFVPLVMIIGLLAFLFKVMHWPGAAKLIWIADIGFVLSGIIFLIDGLLEKDPVKVSQKFITLFFILFLLMIIFLARISGS